MSLRPKGARRSPSGSFAPHTPLARSILQRPDQLHIATTTRNQYARGCCVGQSGAEVVSHWTDLDVSGWWAYLACCRLMGTTADQGTDFATFATAMAAVGTLQYEDDECADDARCLAELSAGISPPLLEQAGATRYRLQVQSVDVHANNAFDAICDALDATQCPMQWATYVNARFEALRAGEIATATHFADDGSGGGHSMIWVGYDRTAHRLRGKTSWGPDFAEQGEFFVDAGALPAIWETHLVLGATWL